MSTQTRVFTSVFFVYFLSLNIAFQLASDVSAGKLIDVLGYGVSVTVLFFPFTYVISDIITEVYGYAKARTVLWATLMASVIAGLLYQLVIVVPEADFFQDAAAYDTVFGIVPRVLVGGWLAVFLGDVVNNYTMAKLKVRTEGKHLWFRTISSTVFGQFVNTATFYVVALSGVIPLELLITSILAGWILKTLVEVLMTPVTYWVIAKVKAIEGVDHYDRDTNFNPFKL